jgi:hypothetical protein
MDLPVPLRRFYRLEAELGIPRICIASNQPPELFDHKYIANLGLSGPKSQITRAKQMLAIRLQRDTHGVSFDPSTVSFGMPFA